VNDKHLEYDTLSSLADTYYAKWEASQDSLEEAERLSTPPLEKVRMVQQSALYFYVYTSLKKALKALAGLQNIGGNV
jgi:hypothetical protein